MQKQAPSIGRILTMVLFALSCFGLLLFLWLSFGGAIPLKPKGYQFNIAVPEATTLGLEADVRVAGVPVGKVRQKALAPGGNRTLITIEIDPRYAPINRDAKAILRQKTLLGETYVELTPGSKAAGALPEGGTLANAQVVPTVQLDEIFTAFDEPTRQAFRVWQQDLAESFQGRGQEVSDAFGNLPSFASDATSALRILDSEAPALQRMIRDTGTVFAAITEDEAALRGLILNSSQVFQATAEQNDKIAETFRTFPTFLDESKATFTRLRTFALETDPLITDLRPVARDLRPTLRDLRGLSPDLKQLFVDLGPLIDVSHVGLPALNETLRGLDPLLEATTPFLEELNPILQWLQLYSSTLTDFLGNAAGGQAAKVETGTDDEVGHYLRQISPNGPQNLGFARERSPDNRGNTYLGPTVFTEQRTANEYIFPNWDCKVTGGPVDKMPPDRKGPSEHPENPVPHNSRPGQSRIACFVQQGIPFKDEGARENFGGRRGPHDTNDAYRRFPHIDHNHYRQDGE
jgi:virulence factor Mce-like protein